MKPDLWLVNLSLELADKHLQMCWWCETFNFGKCNLNQTMKKKIFSFPSFVFFFSPCRTLLHSGINSRSGRPVLPDGAAKSICWTEASKKMVTFLIMAPWKRTLMYLLSLSLALRHTHSHAHAHTKDLRFRRISQIQEVISKQAPQYFQQLRWCKGSVYVCWAS